MPKLRKMFGDIHSPECVNLMRLIETQSKTTLAAWAVGYAKKHYLELYEAECPGDLRLRDTIAACEAYFNGIKQQNEIKPLIRQAGQIARDRAEQPTAQAAARAVSTACAAIQTPTNALGFLFYGAAASAYSQAGLRQEAGVYDEFATIEFKNALDDLKQAAVPDEPCPAKINWNC